MAGFSVSQMSDFLALSESHIRVIFRELGCEKGSDNMLHMPLRTATNLVLSNPKYRQIFRERLNKGLIATRYYVSALILNDDISIVDALRSIEDIKYAATTDYCDIPTDLGFTNRIELTNLCQIGTIVARKTHPGKTGKWRIPVYAFAVYLKEHPQYAENFEILWNENNEQWKENDVFMYKLNNSIRRALNRSRKEEAEVITISLVADILKIPENQVNTIFHNNKTISSVIRGPQPILVSDLIDYILEDDTRLEDLRNRWLSCDSDDPLEPVLCRLLSHATAKKIGHNK